MVFSFDADQTTQEFAEEKRAVGEWRSSVGEWRFEGLDRYDSGS
jgi:hypothetical protein